MPWATTMLGLVENMVGSSARSDSRPKAADRHHRHGTPTTAVSISRLHLPTHTDCSRTARNAATRGIRTMTESRPPCQVRSGCRYRSRDDYGWARRPDPAQRLLPDRADGQLQPGADPGT